MIVKFQHVLQRSTDLISYSIDHGPLVIELLEVIIDILLIIPDIDRDDAARGGTVHLHLAPSRMVEIRVIGFHHIGALIHLDL